MDDYIYGIIKENGVNSLRKVSYPIKELFPISDYELCKSHEYATSFYSAYCDSLCSIDIKQLASNENARNIRKAAVCFEHSTKKFEERYGDRIVAMSHRRGGWYGINWKFNDDISFNINTNFRFVFM